MKEDFEVAIATGHRYVERNPDAAVGYEILGRVAKHRGEDDWQDLLKKAADRYAVEGRMQSLNSAANLYGLSGHFELADQYWQLELSEALTQFQHNKMFGREAAIAAAYFLEDQQQFEQVCNEVVAAKQGWWASLPRVREAYLARDQEAISVELAQWQRYGWKEPIASNGANPSAHDMVEHISQLLAELTA